jgi:type 1 glutamine amidotransferase
MNGCLRVITGGVILVTLLWVQANIHASEALAWVTNDTVVISGKAGPGAGKHIVFVSGDEEYRSEESLPMLARILAGRHGFKCTVLFAINKQTGDIDPNVVDNIPGMEALTTADLMVICTRFRELPDEQMRFIDAFLQAGKPVVGIRPAVVAFRNAPAGRFFKYSSDNKGPEHAGGFGQQVLGSTWISHYGVHGQESTRGVPVATMKSHPILRGVGIMWGPTDVYTVRMPIPHEGQVLVMGHVLRGMTPDNALSDKPPMPMAWIKPYPTPKGNARVFMTTMGASQDFADQDFRRLVVNACFWAVGLEEWITPKTNVDPVGDYRPTAFGFDRYRKGVKPANLAEEANQALRKAFP